MKSYLGINRLAIVNGFLQNFAKILTLKGKYKMHALLVRLISVCDQSWIRVMLRYAIWRKKRLALKYVFYILKSVKTLYF